MSISVGTYNPQHYYHHQGYASTGGLTLSHPDYFSTGQYQQSPYDMTTEPSHYIPSWLLNSATEPGLRDSLNFPTVDLPEYSYGPLSPKVYYDASGRCSYYDNVVQFRGVKRRVTANKKERRRTESINSAFAQLRGCIPNVPLDTKLSKIKTLRLATSYISYLMELLARDDIVLENTFKADVQRKNETKNNKKIASLLANKVNDNNNSKTPSNSISGSHPMDSSDSNSEVEPRCKGRTGWPQTVWASELK